MDFKVHPRPKPGVGTKVIPKVAVTPGGLYLNRKASDMVGTKDKFRAVLVYYDKDTTTIGLWFWKDRDSVLNSEAKNAYSITYYPPTGISKISCKSFIEQHQLVEKAKVFEQVSFPMVPHNEWEGGENFYAIKIQG